MPDLGSNFEKNISNLTESTESVPDFQVESEEIASEQIRKNMLSEDIWKKVKSRFDSENQISWLANNEEVHVKADELLYRDVIDVYDKQRYLAMEPYDALVALTELEFKAMRHETTTGAKYALNDLPPSLDYDEDDDILFA